MATLSLTATAQPSSNPPGVRLDVSASGTPAVTSVTITRTDVSGRTYPVRTSDGGALPVSGGVATIFDYEMPYGTTSTYSAAAAGVSTVTTAASIAVDVPWLVHPGVPSRSMPVDFRAGTNDEEQLAVEEGVFPILGSAFAVTVSGGARQAASSELLVRTKTPVEEAAMRLLLSDGSPLLLNVPPLSGTGLSSCYMSVGAVVVRRRSNLGSDQRRIFALPYRVVGRPAGGSQAQRTHAVVDAEYPTYANVKASGLTYAELSNPIT